MRTYSHALLTYEVIRLAKSDASRKAALAALGATLPDTPAVLGAAWLWTKRKGFSRKDFDEQVCGRTLFKAPDAALHSAPVAATAMLIERILRRKISAFLLGWAGHVVADFLTHGKDARPILWPISQRKFESPVSYREKERYGKAFTVAEHATVLGTLIGLLIEARQSAQEAD
ncbi:MAG: zinc dependent phospholipase C family protein [Rubrobacteraceae bacterium]